ncbi:RHS repeat domain-containing protein, partial [Streptococcus pyogenes]
GRLTGRKLPGGQIEAMLYNSIGQLTAKTDFAGKTTHYAYDQRGRLTQKIPDASLGEATVSFSYPNELTKISTRGSIQNI